MKRVAQAPRCPWRTISERIEALEAEEGGQAPKGPQRGRGRPRGRFDASIDWPAIEELVVYGEDAGKDDLGFPLPRHFPSFRELSSRFGVSHSMIHRKSQAERWVERRELWDATYKQELTVARAKASALDTASQLAIIDEWLLLFQANIKAGTMRADSVNDLDKLMRLKKFMEGEAESSTKTEHVFSLQVLQDRHARVKAAKDLARDEEAAGVLGYQEPPASLMGDAVETQGFEVREQDFDPALTGVQPADNDDDQGGGVRAGAA